MRKLILLMGLMVLMACNEKSLVKPISVDCPIPLGKGYSWEYGYSEIGNTFKICSIISVDEVGERLGFVVKETWFVDSKETASFEYLWQWDDPKFRIYTKAKDKWEPLLEFCLYDSLNYLQWGNTRTTMVGSRLAVQLPYGTVTYFDCYKFKVENLVDNSVSYYWIKEGVGFVKQEFKQTLYLVKYSF